MAPGLCVTSFRMLMRRSELRHLVRASCGLRLNPASVSALAVNSWDLRRRTYCTDNSEKFLQDSSSGQTNHTKASQSKSNTTGTTTKTTTTIPTTTTSSSTSSSTRETTRKNVMKIPSAQDTNTKSSSQSFASKSSDVHTYTKAIDLSQMKVAQLRTELRQHGLNINGTKSILIGRLQNHLYEQSLALSHGNPDEQNQSMNPEILAHASSSADVIDKTTDKIPSTFGNATRAPVHSQHDAEAAAVTTVTAAMADEHTLLPISTPPQAQLAFHSSSPSVSILSDTSSSTASYGKNGNAEDINHSIETEFCKDKEDVSVEYIQGLPHLTIPLPSRNEKCRFALKPVSHKVGDLINMLKTEDRGIDRAAVLNKSGVRIASTCNIESLMDEPFWLHINDQKYKVVPPPRDRIQIDDISKLGDVRALVAQLYEALHVGEYHLHKEQEMTTKLEDLKYQIAPLERQKIELSAQAERRTNIMTWVGLGLMSVQFGILARLTWWEYSWDIMEPVTYFVTYGTAMAMYAYFCITKTEYNMPEVRDRQYLLTIHKRAKRTNFDVDTYNSLKRKIAEIEFDLRRLHDPLNMQLPPHVDRSQQPTLPTLPPAPSSSSSTASSASTSSSSSSSSPSSALTTRISSNG